MSGRRGSQNPPQRVGPDDRKNLLGTTLDGRYLLRSIIGEGGMGKVFEAVHLESGLAVAAKVLNSVQAQRGVSVKRFQQEARAAASIGHGNICQVYDMGELGDGSPYMIMERLVGESLADRIAREGGLSAELVVDVVLQVLSGLDAAHRKGIIHRDIKPENIFLTSQIHAAGHPLVKIVDFGVSKMMPSYAGRTQDEELSLTRTGMVMGTPYYMSPEQARGERDLDGRVDVYATGVLLYEALTGRRPFTGQNYNALLLNILTGPVKPLRELRPDLSITLERVVEKAMRRPREQRYQNAAAFHAELLVVAKDFSARVSSGSDETRAAPWILDAVASARGSQPPSRPAHGSRPQPASPSRPPVAPPRPAAGVPPAVRSAPPASPPQMSSRSPAMAPRGPSFPDPRVPIPTPDGTTERRHVEIPDELRRAAPGPNRPVYAMPEPSEFDDLPTDIQESPLERHTDFDDDEEQIATVVRNDGASILRDVREIERRRALTPTDDTTRIDRPPRSRRR